MQCLPESGIADSEFTTGDYQKQVVAAISKFVSNLNMEELKESGDDLLDTLVETLRDAIMAAPEQCLDHPALDILFTLASQGANSFATSMLVNEAFESISSAMAALGLESYTKLCAKVGLSGDSFTLLTIFLGLLLQREVL